MRLNNRVFIFFAFFLSVVFSYSFLRHKLSLNTNPFSIRQASNADNSKVLPFNIKYPPPDSVREESLSLLKNTIELTYDPGETSALSLLTTNLNSTIKTEQTFITKQTTQATNLVTRLLLTSVASTSFKSSTTTSSKVINVKAFSNLTQLSNLPPRPNENLKQKFNYIYEKKFWGPQGDGSGPGSTLEYTRLTREIIYKVVNKYKINSMLDAPCGGMLWMPVILRNLSASNANFRYHGIDLVDSAISKTREKYKNDYKNWQFSVYDLTRGNLPNDYDLIFSRDALQHIPLLNVYEALKSFAAVKNSKYLLVGSYLNSTTNVNIAAGDYFSINLTLPPFNLDKFVEVFKETIEINSQKYLVLYDIPNYLSKVDFDKMKSDILKFN